VPLTYAKIFFADITTAPINRSGKVSSRRGRVRRPASKKHNFCHFRG